MLRQVAITDKQTKLLDNAPELLEACKIAVNALNQVPNQKLTGKFKDSYAVCSFLDQIIKKAEGK